MNIISLLFSAIICQYDKSTINCGAGEIKIQSVIWGREGEMDEGMCEDYFEQGDCEMSDYTRKIGRYCDGHSACQISSNGRQFSYFRCVMHAPYAVVRYTCIRKGKRY